MERFKNRGYNRIITIKVMDKIKTIRITITIIINKTTKTIIKITIRVTFTNTHKEALLEAVISQTVQILISTATKIQNNLVLRLFRLSILMK